MKQHKRADKYVTFTPTGEEFSLLGTKNGITIYTTDKKYQRYGFALVLDDDTELGYYEFVANTPSKLKNLTNAYKLYYMAKYKGSLFHAGISKYPEVVIFATTYNKPEIEGFRNLSRGEWVKEVDASEVEIIPIKEEIDLSKYLPQEDK